MECIVLLIYKFNRSDYILIAFMLCAKDVFESTWSHAGCLIRDAQHFLAHQALGLLLRGAILVEDLLRNLEIIKRCKEVLRNFTWLNN